MSFLSDLLGDAYKEGMTEEEISEALEGKQQKQKASSKSSEAEINRLKAALSKSNSEAADYKKQLRAKQSDDEAAAAAQAELLKTLQEENEKLKRDTAVNARVNDLIKLGYDGELALDTANAMMDGDMTKVIANQQTFMEVQKKNIIAEQMKSTPRPQVGNASGAGVDYTSQITEAQARGDMAEVAYLMRLQQTELNNSNE